jgi:hypothetical protein
MSIRSRNSLSAKIRMPSTMMTGCGSMRRVTSERVYVPKSYTGISAGLLACSSLRWAIAGRYQRIGCRGETGAPQAADALHPA